MISTGGKGKSDGKGTVTFQLTPGERERLERAAESTGESVEAFARRAALDLADDLLHQRTTVVPPEYLDQLFAAEDPARPRRPGRPGRHPEEPGST